MYFIYRAIQNTEKRKITNELHSKCGQSCRGLVHLPTS